MNFLYIKALHIIFVVCWFAALFYIVRLFIYATEAQNKEEPAKKILTDQFLLMQRRLWFIIGWPSLIGTYVFGWWMIYQNPGFYLTQPWMWLKLIFVGFLTFYHIGCHMILKNQKQGKFKRSSFQLRLFNELGTIFLVAITFLVVVKSTGSLVWGMLGLFIFAGILMLFAKVYKNMREKDEPVQQAQDKKKTTDS